METREKIVLLSNSSVKINSMTSAISQYFENNCSILITKLKKLVLRWISLPLDLMLTRQAMGLEESKLVCLIADWQVEHLKYHKICLHKYPVT